MFEPYWPLPPDRFIEGLTTQAGVINYRLDMGHANHVRKWVPAFARLEVSHLLGPPDVKNVLQQKGAADCVFRIVAMVREYGIAAVGGYIDYTSMHICEIAVAWLKYLLEWDMRMLDAAEGVNLAEANKWIEDIVRDIGWTEALPFNELVERQEERRPAYGSCWELPEPHKHAAARFSAVCFCGMWRLTFIVCSAFLVMLMFGESTCTRGIF